MLDGVEVWRGEGLTVAVYVVDGSASADLVDCECHSGYACC